MKCVSHNEPCSPRHPGDAVPQETNHKTKPNQTATAAEGVRVMIDVAVLDAHNAGLLLAQISRRDDLMAAGTLTLDFQRVRFMDTAGASAIAELVQTSGRQTRVRFIGLQEPLRSHWSRLFDTGMPES